MSIKTMIEEAVAAGRAVPHVIAELFHHLEERIGALEKEAGIVPADVPPEPPAAIPPVSPV